MTKSYSYLKDESSLSQKLGREIEHPIRVFDLKSLGIDQERFIQDMLPLFSVLHLDPYDGKRNKVNFLKERFPDEEERLSVFLADYYADRSGLEEVIDLIGGLANSERHEFDRIGMTGRRKRAIARFILTCHEIRGENYWNVKRVPTGSFVQSVGKNDPRSLVRTFREAPTFGNAYPPLCQLLAGIANMVKEARPDARKLEVTMHLMFIFADALTEGDNAPEGIHQDGSDFIVSALVIERAGVTEGESVVYAFDKKTVLLRHTLEVGQGLFQADKNAYWHDVTPVREDPSVPPQYGNRSIIGFDINVIDE